MKILIIKLSAIGDVVQTLPALEAIKKLYPDSEITWVVEGLLRLKLGENGEQPPEEEPPSEEDFVALIKETFDAREVDE